MGTSQRSAEQITWYREILAGLSVAVIAIPGNMAFGLMAFSPLGPEYRGYAITAGMLAAIVPALFLALLGRSRVMMSGPEAPPGLALAAGLAGIAATLGMDPAISAPQLLIYACLTIGLAGVLKTLFGLARLGGLTRFVSYPVLVGLVNGSALVVLSAQLSALFGIPERDWRQFPLTVDDLIWPPLAVATATILTAFLSPKILPKIPGFFSGAVVGLLVAYGLAYVGYPMPPQESFGVLSVSPLDLDLLKDALVPLMSTPSHSITLLAAAATMAILHAVKTVLTSSHARGLVGERAAPNQDLIALGLGNTASAILGGLSANGMLGRTSALVQGGGRSVVGLLAYSGSGVLLLGLSNLFIDAFPQAVISAVMIVIAIKFFDPWLWKQATIAIDPHRAGRQDAAINVATVLVTMLLLLFGDLVMALLAGILFSGIEIIVRQARSAIRSHRKGSRLSSGTMRFRADEDLLRPHLDQIRVLELQGSLFFAAAEDVVRTNELVTDEDVRFLILDFRRVNSLDATAAKLLTQQRRQLRTKGVTLLISYVNKGDRNWHVLRESGFFAADDTTSIHSDTALALQHCSDCLLLELKPKGTDSSIALQQILLEDGFTLEEAQELDHYFTSSTYQTDELIIRQGDLGDSLFILESGSAQVRLNLDDKEHKRLARIAAGAMFGEMALLEKLPRSADIIAIAETRIRRLSAEDFEKLKLDHPEVAIKLVTKVALTLSERLRQTNAMIADLER